MAFNIDDMTSYTAVNATRPVIDLQTSTVSGFIKYLVEKNFKVDSLQGMTEFKGEVLRVSEILEPNNCSWGILNFFKNLFSTTLMVTKVCKVRIPEIHGFIPIPETYDENEQDKFWIDQYDDFIFTDSDITIAPGDIVIATYSNTTYFKDGRILKVLKGPATKTVDISDVGNIRGKFAGASNMRQGDELVDQYLNGNVARKMVVRPVLGGAGKMYSEAADRVNELGTLAKAAGITLRPSGPRSTYRDQAMQDQLYRENPKLASRKPGGHGKGYAIDISTADKTGQTGFETETYKWMYNNAPKYEIVNNGKYFSTAEAWHWEYIPEGDPMRSGNRAAMKALKEVGLMDQ